MLQPLETEGVTANTDGTQIRSESLPTHSIVPGQGSMVQFCEQKPRPPASTQRPVVHSSGPSQGAPLDGLLCAFEETSHVEALLEALLEGPLSPPELAYMKTLCELSRGQIVLENC